jgi:hypothetical protein
MSGCYYASESEAFVIIIQISKRTISVDIDFGLLIATTRTERQHSE